MNIDLTSGFAHSDVSMAPQECSVHCMELFLMEIRFGSLDEILPLRHAVIITGTNRILPYFAGDEDKTARHVGAFEKGRCISCATFLRPEWEKEPAWQLRGTATDPEWRRRGRPAMCTACVRRAVSKWT